MRVAEAHSGDLRHLERVLRVNIQRTLSQTPLVRFHVGHREGWVHHPWVLIRSHGGWHGP